VKPPNHRTLTLAEAINTFAIDHLLGEDFDDLIGHRLEEDDPVLVFDGDTRCPGDLDLLRADPVAFGERFDRWPHDLIIVDGDLAMGRIDLWQVRGMIVLGDLSCDELHLREALLHVGGHLVARSAVRATANKEWDSRTARTLGPRHVRIHGTARSPVVATWGMSLQHLRWTPDSGREAPLVLR
jgi:hypothetical protein